MMSLRSLLLVPDRVRLPALLVLGVLVMAAGVWAASFAQRSAATRVAAEERDGQLVLTAMLDQETGLRGYLLSGRAEFLQPYRNGRGEFDVALDSARHTAAGDGALETLITRQEEVGRTWQSLAARQLAIFRPDAGRRPEVKAALVRKSYMDRFRALNASFQQRVEDNRADQLSGAGITAGGITLGLGLLFGTLGTLLIRRTRKARERDREFTESLQLMRSEEEAHGLLRDHLERSVRGSVVTVLTRNNSGDRLEPRTHVAVDDVLSEPLGDAEPGSCLAARLARPQTRSGRAEPLMTCELCAGSGGGSTCQPLIVGGEVLGSVLMRKSRIGPADTELLAQAVSRAAPALANLRNLALAEARAMTDPLTNLANKRAIQDTFTRMHAHAIRKGAPLSAIVADLDHFKQVNDSYGHDRGDEALAAAADAFVTSVRGSDFVGRMGGEEFVVLLPDTDAEAAVAVAEKLRVALEALDLKGIPTGLTASFGLAAYPTDAVEGDALLRLADRALYLAKKLGRNRVEHATAEDLPALQGATK
jgi:diguanylate cyclase (GGDEF)-like protein